MPPANKALTEFTLFPKLPAELQIKIWKYAIPPPRLVRANVRRRFPFSLGSVCFSTNTPVPGLLGACKTSREAILKMYTTCIKTRNRMIRMDGDRDVLVLFNSSDSFSREPFRFQPLPWILDRAMLSSHVAMFSGVKSMATPNYVFTDRSPSDQWWLLSQFQALERFFPLEGCKHQNLNRKKDGTFLAIPGEHWARLGLEISAEWQASNLGSNYLSKIRQPTLDILEQVGSRIAVVPAYVEVNRI